MELNLPECNIIDKGHYHIPGRRRNLSPRVCTATLSTESLVTHLFLYFLEQFQVSTVAWPTTNSQSYVISEATLPEHPSTIAVF